MVYKKFLQRYIKIDESALNLTIFSNCNMLTDGFLTLSHCHLLRVLTQELKASEYQSETIAYVQASD